MPAERTPHSEDSLLARPLALATRLVLRVPITVLAGAALLAIASLLIALHGLGRRTSRLDLLNPRSSYNQRWLAYLDEFGETDDVIAACKGMNRRCVTSAIDDLAETLAAERQPLQAVLHRLDLSRVRRKGLHYLSAEQLRGIEALLDQFQPALAGDWSCLDVSQLVGGANDRLALSTTPRGSAAAAAESLQKFAQSLFMALKEQPVYESPWPDPAPLVDLAGRSGDDHLLAADGRWGFLLLKMPAQDDQFARGSDAIDRLRRTLDIVRSRHEDVAMGLTGLPVLENDEMRASQRDMAEAGVLSLFGAAALFVAGFGSLRYPLMTVAALLTGIAWSLAYITLSIGHLNILSVSFGAILIGLGIDFGIHYVARYLQLRPAVGDCRAALEQTAASVGPGIVTGGLTTALAFFTALLTDFTGVAELGVIAGGGVLLCVVAALLMLPAFIFLSDRRRPDAPIPEALPLSWLCRPAFRFPGLVLLAALLATTMVATGAASLRYDHNLLHLQPVGLASVDWERALLAQTDQSVWCAVSMAESREAVLERKRRFEQLDSVERVEEIASLLPDADPEKERLIADIRRRLAELPEDAPLIPAPNLQALTWQLARAATLLQMTGDHFPELRRRLDDLAQHLRNTQDSDCSRRLAEHQQRMACDLLDRLHGLGAMADPGPPRTEDLPPGLVRRFVGKSNRQLLKIYARGDIWEMETLERFVRDVESVDPRGTGHPVQTYYASRQMQRSYIHAAIYSLLAVAIVLMLDFRSIRHTLLAMLPMGLGMAQLFGLLGLLDLPLNPANMIVLPLILGIGIDDGVHVMHDFRRQRGRYRLGNSTATALLLTSATTMVGFGSMMIARHRGLRSLGQVLTLGMFCCLVSSFFILPALLTWATRKRERPNGAGSGPTGADGAGRAPARAARPRRRRRRPDGAGDRVPGSQPGPQLLI